MKIGSTQLGLIFEINSVMSYYLFMGSVTFLDQRGTRNGTRER